MVDKPSIITGGVHEDNRGRITFVNDFNFNDVKRFYTIQNNSIKIVRAWQGHKFENKYFFVTFGSFLICGVKIDDWENPSKDLPVEKFIISAKVSQILTIPAGYANGIKALEENSELMIFSSNTLKDTRDEDYRFDANLWFDWKKENSNV